MISPGLLEQLLDVTQRLRCRVLAQDGADVGHTLLHVLNGLLVRPAHPADLEGVNLVDQAVRLVGQLPDDAVPLGKALVTRLAVGKSSREATGADVAAGPGHALHADALTAALVALRLGDAPRVAVTCWGKEGAARWGRG